MLIEEESSLIIISQVKLLRVNIIHLRNKNSGKILYCEIFYIIFLNQIRKTIINNNTRNSCISLGIFSLRARSFLYILFPLKFLSKLSSTTFANYALFIFNAVAFKGVVLSFSKKLRIHQQNSKTLIFTLPHLSPQIYIYISHNRFINSKFIILCLNFTRSLIYRV